MSKCQIVDCSDEGEHTELWRIGDARAFVSVCPRHGIADKAGARTSIEEGKINRKTGQAGRSEVA